MEIRLTPEDTKAIPVDAAIGMLVTDNEIMARRALTFLRGRFGLEDLGWFYKEGFYNVLVLGKPEEYAADEAHFERLRQSMLTICHTDLLQAGQLQLEVFQEVSL